MDSDGTMQLQESFHLAIDDGREVFDTALKYS